MNLTHAITTLTFLGALAATWHLLLAWVDPYPHCRTCRDARTTEGWCPTCHTHATRPRLARRLARGLTHR